jgi:hypothetical protein
LSIFEHIFGHILHIVLHIFCHILHINTLKVARKSALVKVADSGIAALRIVSGLVWVLSGYIALPHKFMGVCRDWGDVICLASYGDYLAPTQRGMFYTEL